MTAIQKAIKYIAVAFALLLAVGILGGILRVIEAFGGFFSDDNVAENVKTYTVSSNISALEVKINAADFTIKQGDKFYIESNLEYLTVTDKNGVLKVKETKNIGRTYNGALLTLYIPQNTEFEKAYITTGAGRLTVDYLAADIINFELGAGEVNIDTLISNFAADIEGGAGRITISGGALHNLDFDMGVGQLNFTAALTGESEFNLGIGESNITVIGNKDDYRLEIEKGLGNITVDGTNITNIKDIGSGKNSIDISGGIGTVNLKFVGIE